MVNLQKMRPSNTSQRHDIPVSQAPTALGCVICISRSCTACLRWAQEVLPCIAGQTRCPCWASASGFEHEKRWPALDHLRMNSTSVVLRIRIYSPWYLLHHLCRNRRGTSPSHLSIIAEPISNKCARTARGPSSPSFCINSVGSIPSITFA